MLDLSRSISIFTARKRSLGQGNIFAPVCHSVHRGSALRCIYIRAKAMSLPICCIVSTLVFILERFPSESESDFAFAS